MANNVRTEETKRADNNACKTVSAVKNLHHLLAVAADPRFCGTIAVEMSVKDGFYGRPKVTLVKYDPDTSD